MSVALLPNGKQQFIDINGDPLVGGTVSMYVPGTLTPKDTWQDFGQTVFNSNPIVLDSRGQCSIWGDGRYRQRVKDSLGNLIWDEITSTPPDANSANFLVAEVTVDGAGGVPAVGICGDSYVPVACTLQKNVIQSIGVGSVVLDVWVAPFVAGSPPTIANSIVASAPPTLTASESSIDLTLSGWTLAIPSNSAVRYSITSIDTTTHFTMSLDASIP